MNNNGDGKDERTIEPCPYCGAECVTKFADNIVSCTKATTTCPYRGKSIAAHNELCELVEKGREYPILLEHHNRRSGMADEFRRERDEAVGLLRHWRNVLKSAHSLSYSGCNAESTDALLARIDKGGGK